MELLGAVEFARGERQSVVLEGPVELTSVAARPDDATVDELVEHYRALIGEHEDRDAYRKGAVAERRSIVRFTPDRAYSMLELPPRTGS